MVILSIIDQRNLSAKILRSVSVKGLGGNKRGELPNIPHNVIIFHKYAALWRCTDGVMANQNARRYIFA